MACLFFIQAGTLPEVAGTGLDGANPGGLFAGGCVPAVWLFFIHGGALVPGCVVAGFVFAGTGLVWTGGLKGGGVFCCTGADDCVCYVFAFIHGGTVPPGGPPGLLPSAAFFQGF